MPMPFADIEGEAEPRAPIREALPRLGRAEAVATQFAMRHV
jgi:hypothetical protein